MKRHEVHCPSCGSADTIRQRPRGVDDDEEHAQANVELVESDQCVTDTMVMFEM
jgi:hypothetical protein